MAERPQCFLFDNGSLRAASTLSLRRSADQLARRGNMCVRPVSLLHSSAVPATELGGEKAELLEPALLAWLEKNPQGLAVLLPLFFGPSGALVEYLPERLRAIRSKFPSADLRLARPLVQTEDPDPRIAFAIADAVRRVNDEQGLAHPAVLLVDHGSPQPAVTAVRNHLGDQLRAQLDGLASRVGVALMERRPGPDYDFNEPLLSTALTRVPFDSGDVVIALQFLSPGRHAGPDGDIAHICDEARRGRSKLNTFLTEPIANDPRVIDVLLQRYEEAIAGGRS